MSPCDESATHDAEQARRAIEPLTKDVLVRRTLEVFPSGYLTILSIIQGVSLGFTVNTAAEAQALPGPVVEDVATLARAAMTLVGVIIVSYQYIWFTVMMRWRQSFVDSLVPFLLGTAEIVVALNIGRAAQWWFSVSVFAILGLMAFANTKRHLSLDLYNGQELPLRLTSKLLTRSMGTCGGLAVIAIVCALTSLGGSGRIATGLGVASVLVGVSVMVLMSERTIGQIYEYYGVGTPR